MTALSVTNTFVDGNTILAAGHNTNFDDIVTYVNNRNDGSATWDALRVTTSSAVVAILNNSSGASDIFQCQDNGSVVFRVVDGGNVGIGATTPDAQLELEGPAPTIHQDSTGSVYHYIDRGATTNEAAVVFQTAGVVKAALGLDNDSTDTFHIFVGADLGTPKFSMDSNGAAVFNDSGASAASFRVESDTVANMIFVDAANDRLGIGTATPDLFVEVEGSAPHIHQDGSADVYHYVDRGATTNEALVIFQTAGVTRSAIGMDNDSTETLHFFTGGSLAASKMAIDANGALVFNEGGAADAYFRAEGDTLANLFYLDAANDRVGIGTATPDQFVEIEGSAPNIHQDGTGSVYTYMDRGATTDESILIFQTAGVNKVGIGMDNDSTDNMKFFVNGNLATPVMTLFSTGGLNIGSPTGGDKGSGTLNAAADIYKNNSAYTNPDYVFEHWVTGEIKKFANNPGASTYRGFLPLDELESYIREHLDLPGIKSQHADETGGQGIFARADVLLEKIEELTIYILSLHKRIKTLEGVA